MKDMPKVGDIYEVAMCAMIHGFPMLILKEIPNFAWSEGGFRYVDKTFGCWQAGVLEDLINYESANGFLQ